MHYLPLGIHRFRHIYQITMLDLVKSCINSFRKADFDYFFFILGVTGV